MATPAFDTLRFQQKLSEVLEPRTATAMAEAFAEATTNFASKSDLEALRLEMKSDNALLRSEMNLLRQESKASHAELRAELNEKLRAQTFLLLGGITALLGAFVAILKLT